MYEKTSNPGWRSRFAQTSCPARGASSSSGSRRSSLVSDFDAMMEMSFKTCSWNVVEAFLVFCIVCRRVQPLPLSCRMIVVFRARCHAVDIQSVAEHDTLKVGLTPYLGRDAHCLLTCRAVRANTASRLRWPAREIELLASGEIQPLDAPRITSSISQSTTRVLFHPCRQRNRIRLRICSRQTLETSQKRR